MLELSPEQIAVAELNGWDPQEVADNNARVTRMHELMRKHSKMALLGMAYRGGLADANSPAKWRKDELAAVVVDQEFRKREMQP